VLNDRRTRFDDLLFAALLVIPALFAGSRYLDSKSEMDQIALRSKLPAPMLATSAASTQLAAARTSIVHRF
jgi:hypothetical protein